MDSVRNIRYSSLDNSDLLADRCVSRNAISGDGNMLELSGRGGFRVGRMVPQRQRPLELSGLRAITCSEGKCGEFVL